MNPEAWGYYRPNSFVQKYIDYVSNKVSGRKPKKRFARLMMRFKQIYDIELAGLKYRCFAKGNATERNLVFRGMDDDPKLISIISNHLHLGDTFIDIGANCGSFSLNAARIVGQSGRVVAVEPNPFMIPRLQFNVDINRMSNISIVPYAVSNSEEERPFYCNYRQLGNSALIQKSSSQKCTVKTKMLFDLLTGMGIKSIGVMKIDIEGTEYDALSPFFNRAPKDLWPRHILVENHCKCSDENEVISLLTGLGYAIGWHGQNDDLLSLNYHFAARDSAKNKRLEHQERTSASG